MIARVRVPQAARRVQFEGRLTMHAENDLNDTVGVERSLARRTMLS